MNMSLARRGDPDAIWQFHVIHGTPTPDCRQGHNQTQNGGEPVGMRFLHRSWLCSVPPKSAFEKWVAWATRPFRSATRRPERARLSPAEGCPYSLPMRSPFRPASRRTAQASGLCYPKRNLQTRSKPPARQPAENRRDRQATLGGGRGGASARMETCSAAASTGGYPMG